MKLIIYMILAFAGSAAIAGETNKIAIIENQIHRIDFVKASARESTDMKWSKIISITNRTLVSSICNRLENTKYENGFVPLTGILCSQQFINSNNTVMAQVDVILHKGIITIKSSADDDLKVGVNETYSRLIYDIMMKHATNEMRRINEDVKRLSGNSVSELLFGNIDVKIE